MVFKLRALELSSKIEHNIREMLSLLELPQSIWRENIVYFLNDVVDLVRVDNALMNKGVRETFLANISGCKRFNSFRRNRNGKIRWFVLRNIIVSQVLIYQRFHSVDAANVRQFMSNAISIDCYNALSLENFQPTFADLVSSSDLLELTMHNCDFVDVSPLATCSSLTCLHMEDCRTVSNESFSEGISGCLQLRTCHITGCTELRVGTVIALLQNCAQLNTFFLRGSFDFEGVFTQLTAVLSLESFTCTDSSDAIVLTSAVVRDIASIMPCLHTLYLQYDNNLVTNEDINVLLGACRLITHLQLSTMHLITSAALQSIMQQLPLLQTLYIDQCRSIQDAAIIALAQAAQHLRTLRLSGLDITNAAIHAVGTHCRVLQNLNVSYCGNLTDDAFSTINVSCLQVLNLSGTRVTGTFAAHIFSPHSILEGLVCQPCYTMNSSFMQELNCYDKLEILHMGSVHLTKSDWLQISTLFPKLNVLSIQNARTVDDEVAESFKTHCTDLEIVDYKDCNVSDKYLLFL